MASRDPRELTPEERTAANEAIGDGFVLETTPRDNFHNGFAAAVDWLAARASSPAPDALAKAVTALEDIAAHDGADGDVEGVCGTAADALKSAEIARLRKGLEDALQVSFTVGLRRSRAEKAGDAELAEWGERLKAQLVAMREVLSPGTADFMAAMRQRENPPAPVFVGDEPGICGVICNCGPNGEPMACGFVKGHEPTAHSWSSLPTWTERWRIVHNPHIDPKKSSMAIEGPPTNGSQIVYGVAMDRGVPAHERKGGGDRG